MVVDVAATVRVVAVAVAETGARAVAVGATKARVAEAETVGRAVVVGLTKVRAADLAADLAAEVAADAVDTRMMAAAVEVAVVEDEAIVAGVALSVPAGVEVHPQRKGMTYPQRSPSLPRR